MAEPKLKALLFAGAWEGTHITFALLPFNRPRRKTLIWNVLTKDGIQLGTVKWFSRWRKYCFFPAPECVFEEVCLAEIGQFIVDRTRDHKTGEQHEAT